MSNSQSHQMLPFLYLRAQGSLGALELNLELATNCRAIGIVGPSGSGKSTVLRVLAGVQREVVNRVRFRGETWSDGTPAGFVSPWDRRVGWVPQEVLLFPHLTVHANLVYGGRGESVTEVARSLEIAAILDRRPGRLSGGERQRVALGRALLSRPRLLLLDEPFSALDRPLRAHVASVVARFCKRWDVGLVLVSHDEENVGVLVEERWRLTDGSLRRLA